MQNSTGFIGFPDKKMSPIYVPDFFFTDLLPQIDDMAELKLTLHCFWLLNEQKGTLRYLRGDDLRSDWKLLESLAMDSDLRAPLTVLEDALERTIARNTLLRLEISTTMGEEPRVLDSRPGEGPDDVPSDVPDDSAQMSNGSDSDLLYDGEFDEDHAGVSEAEPVFEPDNLDSVNPASDDTIIEDWYFMNTVKGRQTLAMIRQGKLHEVLAAIPDEARLHVERPNIFVMYEQNVGFMSPMIAEQLRDMEKTYSPDWVEEAFEIAVSKNVRNLKYIQAILKRWETDGREGTSSKNLSKGKNGYEKTGRNSERHSEGQRGGQRGGKQGGKSVLDEYSDIIVG